MLAKASRLIRDMADRSGAPRNRYWPRGETIEQREKQMKIKKVEKKAIGMIDGLTIITRSIRGPNPSPKGQ